MTATSKIANYTTSVPVSRTVATMADMLTKAGATRVTQVMDETGIVGMEFGIMTEFGWRPYRVPVRVAPVTQILAADTSLKPSQRAQGQGARVAWRIAHDWLRAQLALIQAGMVTLDEVMFPYALIADETTAYEAFVQRQVTQ